MEDRDGLSSGNGMVMGFAIALVFSPAMGTWAPVGLMLGAAVGLVFGAAFARHGSER